jgi:hypothetical protein
MESWERKLARADEHMKALDKALKRFVNQRPYRAVIENVDPGREAVLRARIDSQPPDELSALIGDALFNMRSGLDHIAWRLSKPTTDQEGHVEFPIFGPGREADYAKTISRKLPGASMDALKEVEAVQPFNGKHPGWHPLWRLYLLSNRDRHRLLHLTGATAQLAELHYTEVRDMSLTLAEVNPVGAFEDGAVLARVHTVPTGPHPSMEIKLRTLWAVAFASDTPAPNMVVSVLMWAIRDYVHEVVVARLKPFIV